MLTRARRHSGYWLLNAGFFVCGFHVAFIATHLPSFLTDNGLSHMVGATVLALVGLANIFGSSLFGWLGDRYSRKYLLSLLYLVRANQTFMAGYGDSLEAGLAAIEAPTLMLYSENDLVFAPEGVRRTAELIEADGTEVALETLEGNRGHLDGVVAIEQASDTLRAFLE